MEVKSLIGRVATDAAFGVGNATENDSFVTFNYRYCWRLLLLRMIIRKLVDGNINDDDLGIKYQPLSQEEPLCRTALAKISYSLASKSGVSFDV